MSDDEPIPVGIDLGGYNARVAIWDDSVSHPVVCHNHDGQRASRVLSAGDNRSTISTTEELKTFFEERIMALAIDAAHTKNLTVVSSIADNFREPGDVGGIATAEILALLQTFGSVITESVAVCLAYGIDPTESSTILVLDGGAAGLKATTVKTHAGFFIRQSCTRLATVSGQELVAVLGQSTAQQFEQKHRFPRGEVWESKKARAKLGRACEEALLTLQINNSATIHIDGLYEGMDCQVVMSKPKFEHASRQLVSQAKTFLNDFEAESLDKVLLSGSLTQWMEPLIPAALKAKIVKSTFDPAEAVAIGCTQQAALDVELDEEDLVDNGSVLLEASSSPVSIGIGEIAEESDPLIPNGCPIPYMTTYECKSAIERIWQLEPEVKPIALLEDALGATVYLLITSNGKLRIWVDGEKLTI